MGHLLATGDCLPSSANLRREGRGAFPFENPFVCELDRGCVDLMVRSLLEDRYPSEIGVMIRRISETSHYHRPRKNFLQVRSWETQGPLTI